MKENRKSEYMNNEKLICDGIDHQLYPIVEGVFLSELDVRLRHIIKQKYPDLKENDFISNKNLTHYRMLFLNEIVDKANRKNDFVRELVYDVAKGKRYTTLNVQDQLDKKLTFGQRIADDVARFGGSWTFIISFIIFMVIWMAINVIKPFGIAFDQYPFILLNLALSTIAAIQAPLIMMSQNRASEYDRLQAKNDYNVNKISEEGIRLLHTKIDHLVQQDQSDLLEIQKLQTEMLASLTNQVIDLQNQNKELFEELTKITSIQK